MSRTSPYPSDLSDAEWALLEPLLQSSERHGRPPKWPARRVADAIFYLFRSVCAWRMLPREYPPWQTVYYHFWTWRRDGRALCLPASPSAGASPLVPRYFL